MTKKLYLSARAAVIVSWHPTSCRFSVRIRDYPVRYYSPNEAPPELSGMYRPQYFAEKRIEELALNDWPIASHALIKPPGSKRHIHVFTVG